MAPGNREWNFNSQKVNDAALFAATKLIAKNKMSIYY
jgi:hypothetical protein